MHFTVLHRWGISWKWRAGTKEWDKLFIQEADWDNGAYVVKLYQVFTQHARQMYAGGGDASAGIYEDYASFAWNRENSREKCTFAHFSIIIRHFFSLSICRHVHKSRHFVCITCLCLISEAMNRTRARFEHKMPHKRAKRERVKSLCLNLKRNETFTFELISKRLKAYMRPML